MFTVAVGIVTDNRQHVLGKADTVFRRPQPPSGVLQGCTYLRSLGRADSGNCTDGLYLYHRGRGLVEYLDQFFGNSLDRVALYARADYQCRQVEVAESAGTLQE